ncbi:ABC transporter permease [Companilactobacillus farciminis]|uniref:ABC transporter permease n=1 Tax=Companilactobacillus farciminis TaxID=1612 RepID=UPI003530ABE8
MLGIIIGIASVICILAIGDGFTHTVTKGMGNHNVKIKLLCSGNLSLSTILTVVLLRTMLQL